MNVQSARFPLMDSLRAIAALSVFVYHLAFVLGWFDEGLAGRYLRELNLGVSIFFVLSGFLLYRPFVAARVEGEPSPALVPYAIRRVARIVPAYWVALTIIAIWLPVSGVFTAEGIVTYYGFLQAYDPDTITGGIGQAWTLTVEVSFYILLPILALGAAAGPRACGPRRAHDGRRPIRRWSSLEGPPAQERRLAQRVAHRLRHAAGVPRSVRGWDGPGGGQRRGRPARR